MSEIGIADTSFQMFVELVIVHQVRKKVVYLFRFRDSCHAVCD